MVHGVTIQMQPRYGPAEQGIDSDREQRDMSRAIGPHIDLVRASILRGEHATVAWNRWRSTHDVDADESDFHALLPAVAVNVERESLGADAATLSGLWKRSWYLNTIGLQSAGWAIDTLAASGIRSALCKGGALLVGTFTDHGRRTMADCDLLVDAHNFEESIDLLIGAGWRLKGAMRARAANHECGLLCPNGRTVEIHRWLSFPRFSTRPDDRFLLDRSITVGDTPIVQPADSLVIAITHGAGMTKGTALNWPLDAVTIVRTHGHDDGFWDRVVESANRTRSGRLVDEALRFCSATLGADIEVPPLDRLFTGAPPRRIGRQRTLLATGSSPFRLLANLYLTVLLGTGRIPNPMMDIRNRLQKQRLARSTT